MRTIGILFSGLWLLVNPGFAPAAADDWFTIQVVDDQTGRGVPLVELSTVNHSAWWTDSGGLVAFHEPGLMDTEVFFYVNSPGYEYPVDMFGYRGLQLKPMAGRSAIIKLKRLNIAERLYRITGQGIYGDSILAGRPAPLKQPVLNGKVAGQDTVIAVPYRGKIYWFWGDTTPAGYPLGNFSASGATSELPGRGGLDPSVGVDLAYFVDTSGFSKGMCPLPKEGLKWIEDLLTVRDAQGVERLLAHVNITTGEKTVERDVMQFNDAREIFEPVRRWENTDPHRTTVPFRTRVEGANFYYLSPDVRVPDDLESIADLSRYESFTCLAGEGLWHGRDSKVERDGNGRIRYGWKTGASPLDRQRLDALMQAGTLQREEIWSSLMDMETGRFFSRRVESAAWNQFRGRWIALFADQPGEVWFGEADTPLGPWGYARRVVTHGNYNFYNLSHHPFLDQEGGRLVYFEGTYVTTFSGARAATPRYDYNQIMYRLALDDPRLTLPVAVYRVRGDHGSTRLWLRDQIEAAAAWPRVESLLCFAMPPGSRGRNLAPVYAAGKDGSTLSLTSPAANALPVFVGRPITEPPPAGRESGNALSPNAEAASLSFSMAVLREYRRLADGHIDYFTEPRPSAGWEPTGGGLCQVWKVPNTVLATNWQARSISMSGSSSRTIQTTGQSKQ